MLVSLIIKKVSFALLLLINIPFKQTKKKTNLTNTKASKQEKNEVLVHTTHKSINDITFQKAT
jgi:hypothetical protein